MNTHPFVFAMAALASLAVSLARSAPPIDSTAWHLVAKAKVLLEQNKLKEAEECFRMALKNDRHFTAAMAGLGQVDIAKQDWDGANGWYEKVLEHEPENLDALYHRAICYRETGKFKVLLLRKFDWDKSARHFERVLAKDSLFYDTLYQYAQLLRYREKYTEAILMGHRQIQLKPESVEGQRGLFRLYQYALDHLSENEVMPWLKAHDSEHAHYFIAEAFRQARKFSAADSAFHSCLSSELTVTRVPINLSLVRLKFQLREPQAAEALYWKTIDGISSKLDAVMVFEDLKYIVTEAELQDFRRLSAPQEYVAFFRRFWIRRDPTPAADSNLRLAEHYRRLLHAEENFVFDGFRTWFNNPDKVKYLKFPPTFYLNDRFNDKGLVYIRHGEANERVLTAGADIVPNESWRYGPTETTPEMVFHFVIDDNAIGNNWRLTPMINHPGFLEDRLSWGTNYHRLLRGDPLERVALEDELAQQSSAAVSSGFRTDRHSWESRVQPLDVASYTAFFKAPEGKSFVDLYYGFATSSDEQKVSAPATNILYEHGMAMHDAQWNVVERKRHQITKGMIPGNGQRQFVAGQYRFAAKPDSYHVAFFVRDLAAQRVGGWKQDVRIPQFPESQLALSSIVLATSIAPATTNDSFVKNDLRVVVNPTKHFPRSNPIYVYFEVYNLTPNGDGKASFVIEYTAALRKGKKSGAKKVFGLFGSGSKPATTLVTERQADSSTSVEYVALDLNRAGKGDFRLNIKVKDKNSGKQNEGFIDFALF